MKSHYLIAGLIATASGMAHAEVTMERLLAAGSEEEAGNWLMIGKTFDLNRFSSLDQINSGNVENLRLVMAAPIGGMEPAGFGIGAMQTTPLVDDGFLYLSDPWGTPYKYDLTSETAARPVWICDTGIDKDPSQGILLANRGLALSGNNVISVLPDGRVVACDSDTGDVVWDAQVATEVGEGFTNSPQVVGDKIIVGQSYGDWATRGWIAAIDANSGEELWRFYTIPEPGEPGSETWLCEQTGNPDCWKTGGGAAWVAGSYDPESNLVFWGTGNPVPMYDPEYRPGDNLYTNSTVALDADTGELAWYFQYTPGDYMDYDEVGPALLVETNIDGEDRKVMARFGRNGIFYTLDRNSGAYINSVAYVGNLNWTEGIDSKTGLPIEYDPEADLQSYAIGRITRAGDTATTCPNIQGGTNFFPTAYNPELGLAYAGGIEGCSDLSVRAVDPDDVLPGNIFIGGAGVNSGEQTGSINAVNVSTNTIEATLNTPYPLYGGVMASADLLWAGHLDGTFSAYNASNLEELWSMNVGTSFSAAPITFLVNGTQYVAITGGGLGVGGGLAPELSNMQAANMLWVFALDS
ncbi:PQQ-binding-like beta-propeller repeat protein [Ponticoccus sp. SC2-23]|uniref:pyrroloquinoline quinone-dependent dehydrogenase n=1 Tax=Alexandriicola marinus TaxID=2081710 RepID=UPI000FDC4750|nr:PQQ-binding-like beta-propeller repeat protein [Alexandriicola marinus]MBM1218659.1 PQQ-binding-like beta-propeller repeat protein [Ponticoccus sp. SC6-9]MBM1224269.1 PQQ-binding-like beta-propeller repeat protein [Ponticoccus sp. SC6-15]MBM1229952.1 PQQ-binding-like beta-propeller repeat protein [Ponticoccus sp. SC6-38]MBM1233235.1 PQQ-binding-like beta-propeller repeat protein [Ponticoccus sp. SC6-45]MBM1236815.1 PQQ-binding-like beta-propeller repeat protein [Ponticoccus sp. SC6-49]MBM1